MDGHHDVRVFRIDPGERRTTSLPDNWKPFAVYTGTGGVFVVARKWIRNPQASPRHEVEDELG